MQYRGLNNQENIIKHMQLTIDTKHDSKQEIRKAIKMLMSLVGSSEVYTNDETLMEKKPNVFEEPQADMSGMMSIFDNPPKEEKKEAPEMQFY